MGEDFFLPAGFPGEWGYTSFPWIGFYKKKLFVDKYFFFVWKRSEIKRCTFVKSSKIAFFCWVSLTFGGENGLFNGVLCCFQQNMEKKFWKHAKEIKKHADVFLLINMYFWDDGEGIG